MGFFIPLICLCAVVFLGFFLGLKFYPRLKWKYPSNLMETGILYFSLLIGLGAGCCLSFVPFSWFILLSLGSLAVLGVQFLSISNISS